jgi:hypothetical protein
MAGTPTPSEVAAAAAKKGKQLTPEELQARRDSALTEAKRAEDEAAPPLQIATPPPIALAPLSSVLLQHVPMPPLATLRSRRTTPTPT